LQSKFFVSYYLHLTTSHLRSKRSEERTTNI